MSQEEASPFDRDSFLRVFLLKMKTGEIPEGSDMDGWDMRAVRAVAELIGAGIMDGQVARDAGSRLATVYNLHFTMATDSYLSELNGKSLRAKGLKRLKAFGVWMLVSIGVIVVTLLGAYLQKKFGLSK